MLRKCTLFVDPSVRGILTKQWPGCPAGVSLLLDLPGEMTRLAIMGDQYLPPDWWEETKNDYPIVASEELRRLAPKMSRVEVLIKKSSWETYLLCRVSFFQKNQRDKFFAVQFYVSINEGDIDRGVTIFSRAS